jgi:hypothetical protein
MKARVVNPRGFGRKGLFEPGILAMIFVRPFRCERCDLRFYRWSFTTNPDSFGRQRRLNLDPLPPDVLPHPPHRGCCTASTSLSPFPLENTGLSIVPPTRKGNCSLPSFNAAPERRAMVLVKKPFWVVISANPR